MIKGHEPESVASPERDAVLPIASRVQVGVFLGVVLVAIAAEDQRWMDGLSTPSRWLAGIEADWLPFLPWLALAPLFWSLRGRRRIVPVREAQSGGGTRLLAIGLALSLGVLGFLMSGWVGSVFGPLPPAYHDEFSYLFQAKTFLAGRWSFPSFEPMPGLFDQVHVLNEGRFASRYFPGTGAWLAPWVELGNPWLGYWVAAGIVAALVFAIGREIGGSGVGLSAGALAALSPGLVLFSNLLLAHHPTLVGLLTFIWAFLRLRKTGAIRWAILSGTGLAFAMLCRPMTALGICLPFAGMTAMWLIRGGGPLREWAAAEAPPDPLPRRIGISVGLVAPIVCGMAIIGVQNRAITGNVLQTPYGLYTKIYTPRHVYGFNNVIRGEEHIGPKTFEKYDRWAENLTPGLAARNVWRRIVSSLRWTMGIVPLALAVSALAFSNGRNVPCRLVVGAIVSLHLVHVPYWFEGIMGWHYVFESAPLWLLLFAEGTRRLVVSWQADGRPAMKFWWGGLVATTIAANLFTVSPLWIGRLPKGIVEVAFSRNRYAEFRAEISKHTAGEPAVVFVEHDPADRHIDYVSNSPQLNDRVLIARCPQNETDLAQARALFPDRRAFLYRAAMNQWSELAAKSR